MNTLKIACVVTLSLMLSGCISRYDPDDPMQKLQREQDQWREDSKKQQRRMEKERQEGLQRLHEQSQQREREMEMRRQQQIDEARQRVDALKKK